MTVAAWTGAEFEQQLRERGRAYHIHHPFNVMLNSGKATAAQIRGWVDAYVNFARRSPWLEAVCASLTELFAPEIHTQRLTGWPQYYPWIDQTGLKYFQSRVSLARRDVEFALALTLERFRTRAAQERALEVLQFKLDVLWQMNDAMALAYGVTQ